MSKALRSKVTRQETSESKAAQSGKRWGQDLGTASQDRGGGRFLWEAVEKAAIEKGKDDPQFALDFWRSLYAEVVTQLPHTEVYTERAFEHTINALDRLRESAIAIGDKKEAKALLKEQYALARVFKEEKYELEEVFVDIIGKGRDDG